MKTQKNICTCPTCKRDSKVNIPDSEYVAPMKMCIECFTLFQTSQIQTIHRLQDDVKSLKDKKVQEKVVAKQKKEGKIAKGFVYPDEIENYEAWVDEDTGLMWEVKNDQTIDEEYTFEEAKAYAKKLNSDNYAGFSDWRVPYIKDLQSLCRYFYEYSDDGWFNMSWYEEHKQYLIKGSFIKEPLSLNMNNFYYWSCEKEDSSYVFRIDFGNSEIGSVNMDRSQYVRCVRGRL